MKHLIITAIVCLGLVAQSSVVSIDQQPDNGRAIAVTGTLDGGPQPLGAQEMRATVGGDNLSGCWSYKDDAGDTHGVCCVDLWIITVCAGVNWSAIERLLDF